MTANTQRTYLPAAGHDWFLPLYDPLTKLLGFDSSRRRLLDQAALEPHHRVLDVGCGTGTLAVLIKRLYPTVDVTAVDPDPRALARAKRKAASASVAVRPPRSAITNIEAHERAYPGPSASSIRAQNSVCFTW